MLHQFTRSFVYAVVIGDAGLAWHAFRASATVPLARLSEQLICGSPAAPPCGAGSTYASHQHFSGWHRSHARRLRQTRTLRM